MQGLLSRNSVNFKAERQRAAALALPQVLDAGVVALKDQDDGDGVHLVVQVGTLTKEGVRTELEQHLRRSLPMAEYPTRVQLWEDLPLTAGGKVDLPALTQKLTESLIDVG